MHPALEAVCWIVLGLLGLVIVFAFFGMADNYDIHNYPDAKPKPSKKPPREKDPIKVELPRAWWRL